MNKQDLIEKIKDLKHHVQNKSWIDRELVLDLVEQEFVTSTPDYVFVDHLIVMQSTGLLDKNGREIFEGDIVKRYRSPFFKAEWEYLIETVVREGASLLLGRDFGKNFGTLPFDSPFAKGDLLEVIGNVHENPELLEVQE